MVRGKLLSEKRLIAGTNWNGGVAECSDAMSGVCPEGERRHRSWMDTALLTQAKGRKVQSSHQMHPAELFQKKDASLRAGCTSL